MRVSSFPPRAARFRSRSAEEMNGDRAHRRTRIKICGITRVDDARAAADAGADAIGLIFWSGTPRVVTHAQAKAIVGALPACVGVVGLFVDPQPQAVREALAAVPLDLLQFHGRESATFCRSFGRRYTKAIAVRDGVDLLESVSPYDDAAGLLFDAFRENDMPGAEGCRVGLNRHTSSRCRDAANGRDIEVRALPFTRCPQRRGELARADVTVGWNEQ